MEKWERNGAEEDRKEKCLRLKSLLFKTRVFTAGLPVGFHQCFMYNAQQCAAIKLLIKTALSKLFTAHQVLFIKLTLVGLVSPELALNGFR